MENGLWFVPRLAHPTCGALRWHRVQLATQTGDLSEQPALIGLPIAMASQQGASIHPHAEDDPVEQHPQWGGYFVIQTRQQDGSTWSFGLAPGGVHCYVCCSKRTPEYLEGLPHHAEGDSAGWRESPRPTDSLSCNWRLSATRTGRCSKDRIPSLPRYASRVLSGG